MAHSPWVSDCDNRWIDITKKKLKKLSENLPIPRRMRRTAERCLRLLGRRSGCTFLRTPLASIPPRRWYVQSGNGYSSTIKLPKTEYKVGPPHDLSAILIKCVDECYQWQAPPSIL